MIATTILIIEIMIVVIPSSGYLITLDPYPTAQNSPKTLCNVVFGPKNPESLRVRALQLWRCQASGLSAAGPEVAGLGPFPLEVPGSPMFLDLQKYAVQGGKKPRENKSIQNKGLCPKRKYVYVYTCVYIWAMILFALEVQGSGKLKARAVAPNAKLPGL